MLSGEVLYSNNDGPTDNIVEMAKDQVKVIKAVKRPTGQKRGKSVGKKVTVKRKLKKENSKRKSIQKESLFCSEEKMKTGFFS